MLDALFSRPWLRVLSALFTDFAAASLITALGSLREPVVLTGALIATIIAVLFAVWLEKLLEKLHDDLRLL